MRGTKSTRWRTVILAALCTVWIVLHPAGSAADVPKPTCYETPVSQKQSIGAEILTELLLSHECVTLRGARVEETWYGPPIGAKAEQFVCIGCEFKRIVIHGRPVTGELRFEESTIDVLDIGRARFLSQVSLFGSTLRDRVDIHRTRFEQGFDLSHATILASVLVDDDVHFAGLTLNSAKIGPMNDADAQQSYGPFRFEGVTVADLVNLNSVTVSMPMEFTSARILGTLDLRDARFVPRPSRKTVDIDLSGTNVDGALLVGPVQWSDDAVKPLRLRLAGASFGDVDIGWRAARQLVALEELSPEQQESISERFLAAYQRGARRDEVRSLVFDQRKLLARTWGARVWSWIDGLTTGYGFSLYRIPLLGLAAIGIFSLACFVKSGRQNAAAALGWWRRTVLSVLFGFAAFWGSELQERQDQPERQVFREALGSSLEIIELIGIMTVGFLSILLGLHLS